MIFLQYFIYVMIILCLAVSCIYNFYFIYKYIMQNNPLKNSLNSFINFDFNFKSWVLDEASCTNKILNFNILFQNQNIIDQVDFCFVFLFLKPILAIFIESISEYFDTYTTLDNIAFIDYVDSFLFALGKFSKIYFFFFCETLNILIYDILIYVYFFFKWLYFISLSQNGFFIYFFFFFLTNIVSFAIQNFLGMYGIFIFNLTSISLFWVSIIYTSKFFLSNLNREIQLTLGQWVLLNANYRIDFSFCVDSLSYSFMLLTTSIAFFVYIYAFSYFRYEPHVDRLIIFLNLFVISMIILVAAGNLIILFLGWELIGLTSFFLINFWTTRIATLKAAFKAFLFNRISDVSLFFTCVFTFYLFTDLTNSVIIQNFLNKPFLFYGSYSCVSIFSFSLIIPVCIKSAQFFWHIWLPDSMEAPVPASALIHSATLVSAGVYLVLRFKQVLLLSEYAVTILPIIGAVTACLGAVSSAFQTDVKRLLAYSTISHCGFLIVSAIMCDSEYTVLYLYVHGFFKAASFICIGNVIRFNMGYQDIRVMGGYAKVLPYECLCLFLCLTFLAGAPFTLGFFMKHFLLAAIPTTTFYYLCINALLFIAASLGVVYCSKLYYGIFFGTKKSNKFVYSTLAKKKFYNYDVYGTFFSVSTIGAAFAIYGLVLTGVTVSLIFLITIHHKIFNSPDFGSNVYWATIFAIKYGFTAAAFFNFGFLNLVMLFIFLFTCIVSFVWIFRVELVFEILLLMLVICHLSVMALFFMGII